MGYNRERELCWGKVVEIFIDIEKVPCCYIWTNKGDSIFLERNSLITPTGPLTVKNIKELFNSSENILIEMPNFQDVSKILSQNGKTTSASLMGAFELNAIPISFKDYPIIKIPTKNLSSIISLAQKFGIDKSSISKYENGDCSPGIEFLKEFAEYLGINGEWLIFGNPPIFKTSEANKDIEGLFLELLAGIKGDTAEVPAETVTFDWLAAKAREKGWNKFDCHINDEMINEVEEFVVKAGDEVEITPYDEHG